MLTSVTMGCVVFCLLGGFVLGLDLQPLPLTIPLPPHVTIMRQDVLKWQIHVSGSGSGNLIFNANR
jgi:hypothetical protein